MEFSELQQIVESNARTIQAMLEAQATDRLRHEEFRETTSSAIVRIEEAIERLTLVSEGIANLVVSLDDDRPTILARLSRMENKLDRLLEQNN